MGNVPAHGSVIDASPSFLHRQLERSMSHEPSRYISPFRMPGQVRYRSWIEKRCVAHPASVAGRSRDALFVDLTFAAGSDAKRATSVKPT
jgi:hypothetical protein